MMSDQPGDPGAVSRRILIAVLAVGWPVVRPVRQGSGTISVERVRIARHTHNAGLAPPLTLGLARVVLPPGAASRATTPGGIRMLFVEEGLLGVALAAPDATAIDAADLAVAAPLPDLNREVQIPAGTSMTFGTPGLAMVRNAGSRPVVLLDAAVYPSTPRPLAPDFTTIEGVSFQLLASVKAESAPTGPLFAVLERLRLGLSSDLPEDLLAGVTLIYLGGGALALIASAGRVYASRAASAPYAMPGALEPIASGDRHNLTAGGVLFLPAGAEAGVWNAGRQPAELLALSLRENLPR